jgi:hypothetical protein
MPRICKEKPLITFCRDTREQRPYDFAAPHKKDRFDDGGALDMTISEGDYSVCIDGGELLPVRVERKQFGEWFAICGKERERFERELERLRPFRSYLLIEATEKMIWDGYERSLVSGKAAWGTIWCFAANYGITPIFGGNRVHSQLICQRILEEFAAHYRGKIET